MATKTTFIRVTFNEPPLADGRRDFYFGSIAAIYDQFTPKQIGCRVENLWNNRIEAGRPYKNSRVTITKEVMRRKTREKDEESV